MSDKPFDGQIIVVTGGGTGIGRATALAFADLGAASVIITGRRRDRLAEVAALHDAVVPVVADVASDKGAHDVAEAVRSHGAQLDVLVQNAGIFRASPLEAFDVKSARDVLETNVVGPVLLTARLLPLLRSPGGSIVLVSSVGGHKPAPGSSVYAASKAALDSFTVSWAKELAPKGIRVNAVAPAAVRTEVYAANGLSQPEIEGFFAYQTSVTPLGRTGEVEDVAPWIVRFAEPASSWVTGQVLTLDGGLDLL